MFWNSNSNDYDDDHDYIMNIFQQFDISKRGFLPEKCCKLAPAEYSYLNDILFIMSVSTDQTFKKYVRSYIMKDYQKNASINNLSSNEIKYIYSLCCLLAHKYIWCSYDKEKDDDVNKIDNIVPFCISKPWIESSIYLGIKPVLTHAAVDLYNWDYINEEEGFNLDNLKCINLINRSIVKYSDSFNTRIDESESRFYLIMTAIEGCCGPMLYNMEMIYKYLNEDNFDKHQIVLNLKDIHSFLILQKNSLNEFMRNANLKFSSI